MEAKVLDDGSITFTMSFDNAVQLRRAAESRIEFLKLIDLEDSDHHKKAVAFLDELERAFK